MLQPKDLTVAPQSFFTSDIFSSPGQTLPLQVNASPRIAGRYLLHAHHGMDRLPDLKIEVNRVSSAVHPWRFSFGRPVHFLIIGPIRSLSAILHKSVLVVSRLCT
jgi:hypothetical protein